MSTTPPGRHPNYCRCPGCRRDIARFESGLLKGDIAGVAILAAIAGIMWVVLAPLRIWHTIGADGQEHPDTATWIAYGIGGAVIMAALMFFSIRATRETPREAAEKARVREALGIAAAVKDLPPPPASISVTPPGCGHLHAEPLTNRYTATPLAWFCAECDTQLPAEHGHLMRPCCGTPPGTRHTYNCPHRRG